MASTTEAPTTAAPAQPQSESSLQSIIAQYMKKKGYSHNVEAISADIASSVEKMAVSADLLSDSTSLQTILNYNPAERFSGSFEQSFKALSVWVDRSLDQCKPELSSVLYPLFVHGYLDLIKRGNQLYASQFMLNHLEEVSPEHKDEVYRLMVVQTPDHLQENDLAQLWLMNKYKLTMSSFSYDLLMTFLQEQNYMMLRTMINDHLAISTFAGYPSSSSENVTLLDKASQDLMESTQPDVHWGVFSEIRKWYDKPDEEEEGVNGEADGAAESEEEAATKKRKRETAAKKKAARSKAEAKAPPAAQRVPIQAEIGIETEKEFLADIKARANLASDALPSVAFYTIFNTHNNMTCSAVSRDAGLVATGFGDSAIKLWDVQGGANGQPSRFQEAQKLFMETDGRAPKYRTTPSVYNELIGHSQSVTSLDFSPDSAYLLSSSADGTVRLWSNETKTNVVCYRGHNFPVWQTRFANLGYYFASASHDRTARLWVTSNVHAMRIFAGHGGDVNTVAFHPNYYYLFTGSTDKTLRLWEVGTGDCVRIFTGHAAAIYDARVCPDGKFAVSAGEDAVVNVWDLAAGKRCAALKGHTGPIWSIDVSNDGALIASGSSDQSVRLWDLRMISDSMESSSSSSSSLAASSSVDRSKFEKAQLGAYFTKSTPVVNVSFTRRNLLTASGPFRPPPEATQ